MWMGWMGGCLNNYNQDHVQCKEGTESPPNIIIIPLPWLRLVLTTCTLVTSSVRGNCQDRLGTETTTSHSSHTAQCLIIQIPTRENYTLRPETLYFIVESVSL